MLSCHLTLFRWDCYLLQVWSTYCNIIQQPLHAFVQRVRDILQLKNMLPSVPFHCCMFVYTLLLAASIHRQWARVGQKLFDPSDHIHDLWVLAHVDVRRVSVISIGHTKYGSTDDFAWTNNVCWAISTYQISKREKTALVSYEPVKLSKGTINSHTM